MSAQSHSLTLSVVFVPRRSLTNIRKILECLLVQTAAARIEFLLSADSPELLREAEDFLAPRSRFLQTRFLLHRTQDMARARQESAAAATGEIVAFTEDHCFPEPNWAEELLAAFESSEDIEAAAPVMINPNPETAVSRVQFLLFFGRHRKDSSAHPRFENPDCLPWHNTAYRRDTLTEVLRGDCFLAEGFVQGRIRTSRPQARFVRCTRTAVAHVNMSRISPAITQAFLGGRIFGGELARHERWGSAARAFRFVLMPLIPVMRIQRSAPLLRDEASLSKTISNFFISWALGLVHAFGEAIGACIGMGLAPDAYADTECDRRRFVRHCERPILLSLQDCSGIPKSEKVR